MAKANILNTHTINYLELIGNGKSYREPPYQRDYSWSEEQWEDLWNDIVELRPKTEDVHYMGALVVEGISDREFLIIDGQQRLATLSLLALAVIGQLQALADTGPNPDDNAERAQGLRSRFIGEKDPASLTESSRLYLNETDDAFYQDYLVQLRPPLNPRGLPNSNRLLWNCFRYFTRRLDEMVVLKNDGQALASLLSETVARQLLFILISVDDELNAYTVFETLNARGLELTTTDLLKNYLFSRVHVVADLKALQRRWQRLIATVGQARFSQFLRYHLLCEQPKVRSQRLFKLVRDRTKTTADVYTAGQVRGPRRAVCGGFGPQSWLLDRIALGQTVHPRTHPIPCPADDALAVYGLGAFLRRGFCSGLEARQRDCVPVQRGQRTQHQSARAGLSPRCQGSNGRPGKDSSSRVRAPQADLPGRCQDETGLRLACH